MLSLKIINFNCNISYTHIELRKIATMRLITRLLSHYAYVISFLIYISRSNIRSFLNSSWTAFFASLSEVSVWTSWIDFSSKLDLRLCEGCFSSALDFAISMLAVLRCCECLSRASMGFTFSEVSSLVERLQWALYLSRSSVSEFSLSLSRRSCARFLFRSLRWFFLRCPRMLELDLRNDNKVLNAILSRLDLAGKVQQVEETVPDFI